MPAYRHAARYLHQLRTTAATGQDVSPLAPHAEFEAGLRAKHGRKSGFWELVKGG